MCPSQRLWVTSSWSQGKYQKSTVECRNPNMFGFRTGPFCSVPNCFERTKTSEIWAIGRPNVQFLDVLASLDCFISIKNLWPPLFIKRPSLACPKSEHKKKNRTTEIQTMSCSNSWSFGFQHYSGFGRSVFVIPLYVVRNLIFFNQTIFGLFIDKFTLTHTKLFLLFFHNTNKN